jgi:hypothetical protein
MIKSNDGSLVVCPPYISVTNATNYLSFDTRGYDYANVYIFCGTHTSTTAVFDQIRVAEHDTTTSASSMTQINALSSSTATSATYDNTLPTGANQGLGGIVQELQIDLRGRKRYLGITLGVVTNNTAYVGAIARLSRAAESADTAAEKSLPVPLQAGVDTNAIGCMQVVTG